MEFSYKIKLANNFLAAKAKKKRETRKWERGEEDQKKRKGKEEGKVL